MPGEQTVAVQANPLFGNQQFTAPHLILVKPVDEEYLGIFFCFQLKIYYRINLAILYFSEIKLSSTVILKKKLDY